MSQASSGEHREHRAGRFAMRTIALIVGLVAAFVALVINILYSLLHLLARATGQPAADGAHFLYGLLVVLLGAVGAFLAPVLPPLAAVLLVVAAVALFFVAGWWALIVSPFFLVAALLTFSNRRVDIPGAE